MFDIFISKGLGHKWRGKLRRLAGLHYSHMLCELKVKHWIKLAGSRKTSCSFWLLLILKEKQRSASVKTLEGSVLPRLKETFSFKSISPAYAQVTTNIGALCENKSSQLIKALLLTQLLLWDGFRSEGFRKKSPCQQG